MKDIYYGSGTVVFDEAYNFWVILSRSRGGVTIQRLAKKSSPKYLLYAKLRHYRPVAVQVNDLIKTNSKDTTIYTIMDIYYEVDSDIVKAVLMNNIGAKIFLGLESLIKTVELHV